MKIIKKLLLLILCLIFPLTLFCGCRSSPSTPKAVWWWKDNLSVEEVHTYLDFAKSEGVNQIYYCTGKFDEDTADFISRANGCGMQVYWLDGDYRWLTEDGYTQKLYAKLEKFNAYNAKYPNAKFSGVHLDIEPHQAENFKENRGELIASLIGLASSLKEKYSTLNFCYDIPFWLEDEVEFGGKVKPAYAHMIDIADGVVVMSYRDAAPKIYSVAEEELNYAQSVGKNIFLSVECGKEEDAVTFYQESKAELNAQLNALYPLLPQGTGMAIHNIVSWYSLKP